MVTSLSKHYKACVDMSSTNNDRLFPDTVSMLNCLRDELENAEWLFVVARAVNL